mmetsp:Transcript_31251/g.61682  ORF Transcript_31251/g.61682 Transcript_31251/m.61682 type:complete len:132 (-) Transcript_31251:365-760(-)
MSPPLYASDDFRPTLASLEEEEERQSLLTRNRNKWKEWRRGKRKEKWRRQRAQQSAQAILHSIGAVAFPLLTPYSSPLLAAASTDGLSTLLLILCFIFLFHFPAADFVSLFSVEVLPTLPSCQSGRMHSSH